MFSRATEQAKHLFHQNALIPLPVYCSSDPILHARSAAEAVRSALQKTKTLSIQNLRFQQAKERHRQTPKDDLKIVPCDEEDDDGTDKV